MADHKVQRPTANKPLTRRQKDINIAINRAGIAKAVAAPAAAAPSIRDILSTRGAAIDAAVDDSQRLRTNQSTDSNN